MQIFLMNGIKLLAGNLYLPLVEMLVILCGHVFIDTFPSGFVGDFAIFFDVYGSNVLGVGGGLYAHLGMSTSDEGCIVDTSLVVVVGCS